MSGRGERLDDLALVRLLALMQGVRALANRAGADVRTLRLPPGAGESLTEVFFLGLTTDIATASSRDATAVRIASVLADPGSPGANPRGPSQVRSILACVAGPETNGRMRDDPESVRHVPLRPLGTYDESTLFPAHAHEESERRTQMSFLWEGFSTDHGALPARTLAGYLDCLATLLQKYSWCVPSGASGSNDVSVYDHVRVTAAIAACLVREASAGTVDLDGLERTSTSDATKCIALIGGDVSGLQKFLYTVATRRALRGLRGRSFYLQLLGEAVVHYLLAQLRLPSTNVLLDGSGHFYLLAPYSSVRDGQFEEADLHHVAEVLHRHHGADLSVAVSYTALSTADLASPAALTKGWRQLGGNISRAKGRKGEHLGAQMLHEEVFQPKEADGRSDRYCMTCQGAISGSDPEHADATEDERRAHRHAWARRWRQALRDLGMDVMVVGESRRKHDPRPDQDDEGNLVTNCHLCDGMLDLGDRLRQGSTLVTWPVTIQERDPADATSQRAQGDAESVPIGSRATAWRLNDAELVKATIVGQRFSPSEVTVGFRLVSQATPSKKDETGSGESLRIAELGDLAEASTGVRRLGFLRADVDNLGGIIRSGLVSGGTDGGTLARRMALSYALRLFFEGHLGVLCAARNPVANGDDRKTDRLYLIYSGGDDLFLAGAWDTVAETAGTIAESLRKYVSNNPAVHLSAGLAIVHHKYPVRQAADEAGEALDDAKSLPGDEAAGEAAKNAISIFGEVIPWLRLAEATALAKELVSAVTGDSGEVVPDGGRRSPGQTPRQVLRLALRLCAMEAETREALEERTASRVASGQAASMRATRQPQVAWGQWMWQALYALKRMESDKRAGTPIVDRVRRLTGTPAGMACLRTGATWADLAIRSRHEGER